MRQMRENVLRKLACKQAFSTDAIWRSATSRWRMLRIRNRDACWTGIMSVSSLKNHWSLNCSLLLFRFELRSLPWTPLADITRFRIRILNWIERSRLFCYSVINLLCRTSSASFAFESQKLLYFITAPFVCQELFSFYFQKKHSCDSFESFSFSQATFVFYHNT